jgi:hypothetical protein
MSTNSVHASGVAHQDFGPQARRLGPRRPGRRRSVVLAMMLSLLSVGAVTPAAMADESPTSNLYDVTVGNATTTLREGESVTYRMTSVSGTSGVISSDVVYRGDTGTITVTANRGVYHHAVDMSVPVSRPRTSSGSSASLTSRVDSAAGQPPRSCSREMCRRVG